MTSVAAEESYSNQVSTPHLSKSTPSLDLFLILVNPLNVALTHCGLPKYLILRNADYSRFTKMNDPKP